MKMVASMNQEHIQVDGIKTFLVSVGTGHPLILIHGASPGASSLVNWKLNLEQLANAGFAVYAYDQPGFGYTDNPSDHSIEYRVRHAKALIDLLKLDHYHVVGNSVGGYIAARLALEDNRVKRFVTTTSGSLSPAGSAASQSLAQKHAADLREYEPSMENMRRLTFGTIFKKALVTEELVRERYEMSIGKNYDAQVGRRTAAKQKPVYDDLSKLRVKSLLLWGNNDAGVSVERGIELFQRIPGAEFHLFDNCAHWVQWDQADRFNRLVSDFLRSAD
ncbi:MAG TPA: alpha/beta hydrolase [Candidatus Limnocylindrales bacterium]|nr:alpha/beta hydrolase [Candidatus Limnocylindrales bacterium]